jgi:hypothetical protein
LSQHAIQRGERVGVRHGRRPFLMFVAKNVKINAVGPRTLLDRQPHSAA